MFLGSKRQQSPKQRKSKVDREQKEVLDVRKRCAGRTILAELLQPQVEPVRLIVTINNKSRIINSGRVIVSK